MNRAMINGQEVGSGEALLSKQVKDGVIASPLISYNESPPRLELTLTWPGHLPEKRIDFVLVAPNDGYSFMAAFRYGTFGLDMACSENSNQKLINDLAETKGVLIKEVAEHDSREYSCPLKHCLD